MGAIAVLLCLAGLALVVLWALRQEPGEAPAAHPQRTEARPDPTGAPPESPSALSGPAAAPVREVPATDPSDWSHDPGRPRPTLRESARGTLAGLAQVPEGVPFPERWIVTVEPSRSLVGSEFAESRRLELTGETRKFRFDDLPLAGYEVTLAAEGLTGRTRQVILTPSSPSAYLVVTLDRAGYVEGVVEDEEGRPIADLTVVLEALPSGHRRDAETDPSGRYHFDAVPDGNYRLFAHDPTVPLGAPLDLSVVAPSLHVPPIRVPVLGAILCRVLDSAGQPVSGVLVRGFGEEEGSISETTGRDGTALARFLPAGPYRLLASAEGFREARAVCSLEAGATAEVEIRMEPRR